MTHHVTHATTPTGHKPPVQAMPRITEATPTTVYATNERGTVCHRCIRCKTWTPIWSPENSKIRIGLMIRMHNPRLGMKMANNQIDERTMLMFPKVKVGDGCPACVEEFNAVVLSRPSAREPFIKVDTL